MFIKGFTFVSWKKPGGVKPNAVLRGLVWALGWVFSFCFALGVWAILSPGAFRFFPAVLGAIALLGVFLGGLSAGLAARNAGWFHGGLVGFCCGMIFLFPLLAGGREFFGGADLSARLSLCTLCGMAGGIAGVNLPPVASGRESLARGVKRAIFIFAKGKTRVGGSC